jgi:hypothetical protein
MAIQRRFLLPPSGPLSSNPPYATFLFLSAAQAILWLQRNLQMMRANIWLGYVPQPNHTKQTSKNLGFVNFNKERRATTRLYMAMAWGLVCSERFPRASVCQ